MKMTIHRALAELKLINAKIEKKTSNLELIGLKKKDGLVNEVVAEDQFIKNAQGSYHSLTDLIKRKIEIKSGVALSNSITVIKFGEYEATVADAINHREIIELKKNLLNKITNQRNSAVGGMKTQNERISQVALENALAILGDSGGDEYKSTDADVKAISDPFVKRNELSLVDPLKLDELIKDLSDSIDLFELEIDAVLSESNSITTIEIKD